MNAQAQNVIRILSHPITQLVDFKVGSRAVKGAGFTSVANAIRKGKISVTYYPLKGNNADYDHRSNVMEVGFKPPANLIHCGLVVHEAVHAFHDIQRNIMRGLEAEVLAYLAQTLAVYYAAKAHCDSHPKHNPFRGFGPGESAWEASKALRGTKGKSPSAQSLSMLKKAIASHPKYRGKTSKWFSGNGI